MPVSADEPRRGAAVSLTFARLTALAGAGIAGYLTWVHLAAAGAGSGPAVPLCGGGWLDCGSVLASRWATLFGAPVAAIGLTAWLALASALGFGRRAAPFALMLAAAMSVAAGWFIYLQFAVLGTFCPLCMTAHGLAIIAAGLVAFAFVRPPGLGVKGAAAAVGLLGGGLLIALQMLDTPAYAAPIEWSVDEQGRWLETGDPAAAVTFSDGDVVLDKAAHPVLGSPTATRYLLEFVDPRCARCAKFAAVLSGALAALGPDYAVIVCFSPAEADCNPYIESTPDYAVDGCALARIALAVWLADAGVYPVFHEWLFANYGRMTVDNATAEAERLVGRDALRRALGDERAGRMIRRDVDLAAHMRIESLPGVVVGSMAFRALPEDPAVMATLIRQLQRGPNFRPDRAPDAP